MAERRTLLSWLRERIWPLEASHDGASMAASASLGVLELLRSGTTAVMDMGSVHHTDAVFEVLKHAGIRALCGKAMMEPGEGVPAGLAEPADVALGSSVELARQWNGACAGRLGYVFSPRFLLSVGEELLARSAVEARRLGCRMQTHASESPDEARIVRERTGTDSIALLERCGFLGPDVVLAHAIHLAQGERDVLARSGTSVAHCPGSNAKLGSGIAAVPELLEAGVNVGIAADGAACNNGLSIFAEMRLAAQMQSLRCGPGMLGAKAIVEMATLCGARALGLESKIGSIEPGKRADLVLMDPRAPHSSPQGPDPYDAIVWSMDGRNVASVWVDGAALVRDGKATGMDEAGTIAQAHEERARLLERFERSQR